jgi:aryl-alcohol dehydrogenase-like predicted oxidoreductase
VLTGKYSRGDGAPTDSKRAEGNKRRLSERNLAIAREVDRVADELGKTSAQVALAWVRQRGRNIIPIVGARKLGQIQDLLGCVEVELTPEQVARLDELSRIDLGFPHQFVDMDDIRQVVYGDLVDRLELRR